MDEGGSAPPIFRNPVNRARAPPPPRPPSLPPPACDEWGAEAHQTLRNPAQGPNLKLCPNSFLSLGKVEIFSALCACTLPQRGSKFRSDALKRPRTRSCDLSLPPRLACSQRIVRCAKHACFLKMEARQREEGAHACRCIILCLLLTPVTDFVCGPMLS